MDREIKFRGRFFTDKWIYGDLVHLSIGYGIRERTGLTLSFSRVDEDTIGQYTGLKDKNGKEIFEGDIVIIDNSLKAVVIWFNGSFRFKDELSSKATYLDDIGAIMRDYDVEVIGNIHDNPELLKGGSNEA